MEQPKWVSDAFLIYAVVMITLATTLLLVLVLITHAKMSRVMQQLDDIASQAAKFVKMGAKAFKDKQ